jgi:uncharacterized protein (TIGR03437 family)
LISIHLLQLVIIHLLTLFAAANSPQVSTTFDGNIILGRPTDRSVTVNVLFNTDQESIYIEYGDTPGSLLRQTPLRTALKARVAFEEVISGLEPNRRYFYRLRFRGAGQITYGATPEYTFHTQRAQGSTFTFTLIADSHLFTTQHCDPARYSLTLRNALADNPDFHLDLGDTFRTDTLTRDPADSTYQLVLERLIAHRPYFGLLTHSAPLFLVMGNHDSEYLYYTKPESNENPNLPFWSTNARLALFSNPRPDGFYTGDQAAHTGVDGGLRESYYAWEWGDALFVVLDPYWEMGTRGGSSWDTIHGDRQYQWFRETLRNSRAKYKFVFEHHLQGQSRGGIEVAPLFEWGGKDRKGDNTFAQNRPGWEKPFHDLLAENNVSVYFQGHDHIFARGFYNGVTYISVPMPAADPDPGSESYFPGNVTDGNFDAYPQSLTLPNSGHVRVTVGPAGVKVEYVTVKLPRDPGINRTVAYTTRIGGGSGLTLVSSANYADIGAASESLVSAFGSGLATTTDPARVIVRDSSGTDRLARILYSSPTQVNFLMPAELATGKSTISIGPSTQPGSAIQATEMMIERVAPALFTANASGLGVPAALAIRVRADGTQSVEPVFNCGSAAGSCLPTPLDLGPETDQLYLALFGTGIRKIANLAEIGLRIGGTPAEVVFAGAQGGFLGLDQINVRIPRSLIGRGDAAVIFSIAGRSSTPVTVNIK